MTLYEFPWLDVPPHHLFRIKRFPDLKNDAYVAGHAPRYSGTLMKSLFVNNTILKVGSSFLSSSDVKTNQHEYLSS